MSIKRFILAAFVSGLVMWVVSGIWHNLILVQFYTVEKGAEHEGILILFIAYIFLGIFMTYFYSKLKKGDNYWFEGVKFGMIMGLLWVFPHELAMAGAHSEPLDYVFKNAIWHLVEQSFGGIVIAVFYRKN